MPVSKKRKNINSQKVQEETELKTGFADNYKLSPSWWAPVFITLLLVGLLWVVVTYIAGAKYPIPGIHNWNIAIGLGIMFAGFLMTLRWR